MSTPKTISEIVRVGSALKATITHEIKSTRADMVWTGPTFTREMWNQVMAFFEWTQRTHHSEAQVRLFLNPESNEWAAWAFPQEGGTGMSSRELADLGDEGRAQRSMFPDPWIPHGTIHHHCSAGAFQSGTDEADESRNGHDGIHITIGNVGSPKYSIHARYYINGVKFSDPDLSLFWDIGISQFPAHIRPYINVRGMASAQMCEPPQEGTTFPEEWKENYQIRPRVTHTYPSGPHGYSSAVGFTSFGHGKEVAKREVGIFLATAEDLEKETLYDAAPILADAAKHFAKCPGTYQDLWAALVEAAVKGDTIEDDVPDPNDNNGKPSINDASGDNQSGFYYSHQHDW